MSIENENNVVDTIEVAKVVKNELEVLLPVLDCNIGGSLEITDNINIPLSLSMIEKIKGHEIFTKKIETSHDFSMFKSAQAVLEAFLDKIKEVYNNIDTFDVKILKEKFEKISAGIRECLKHVYSEVKIYKDSIKERLISSAFTEIEVYLAEKQRNHFFKDFTDYRKVLADSVMSKRKAETIKEELAKEVIRIKGGIDSLFIDANNRKNEGIASNIIEEANRKAEKIIADAVLRGSKEATIEAEKIKNEGTRELEDKKRDLEKEIKEVEDNKDSSIRSIKLKEVDQINEVVSSKLQDELEKQKILLNEEHNKEILELKGKNLRLEIDMKDLQNFKDEINNKEDVKEEKIEHYNIAFLAFPSQFNYIFKYLESLDIELTGE